MIDLKKRIFFILRVLVGLGIIFALFKFIPYYKLIQLYRDSNKCYIILALIGFVLTHILGIYRWQFVLFSLGLRLHFKELFYSFLSSLFFNLFFPSLLAGDIFRSAAINYRHKNSFKIISSVVMDRFSGGFALSAVSLVAFIFGWSLIKEKDVLLAIIIFLATSIIFISLFFNKLFLNFLDRHLKKGFLKKKIKNLYDELFFFRENPKIFAKSLIYSSAIQILTCLVFYLLSKAFFLNINIIYFFIFVPIIMFIAVIPVTVAGIGTREAAVVYFLSKVGVDRSVALGISLAILFLIIFMGLLGGIMYVVVYHRWLELNS